MNYGDTEWEIPNSGMLSILEHIRRVQKQLGVDGVSSFSMNRLLMGPFLDAIVAFRVVRFSYKRTNNEFHENLGVCYPDSYTYGSCIDYHRMCRSWASQGECAKNPW